MDEVKSFTLKVRNSWKLSSAQLGCYWSHAEPANSDHLNEKTELVGIGELTSADRCVMQQIAICEWLKESAIHDDRTIVNLAFADRAFSHAAPAVWTDLSCLVTLKGWLRHNFTTELTFADSWPPRTCRSTQPSTLRGTVKWVPAMVNKDVYKGRWCSAAGE